MSTASQEPQWAEPYLLLSTLSTGSHPFPTQSPLPCQRLNVTTHINYQALVLESASGTT